MRLITCGWDSGIISEHEWMSSTQSTYATQSVVSDPIISGSSSALFTTPAVETEEHAGQLIQLPDTYNDIYVRVSLRYASNWVQQTGTSTFLCFLDSSMNCLHAFGKSTASPYTALRLFAGGTNYGSNGSSLLSTQGTLFANDTNTSLNIRYNVDNSGGTRRLNIVAYNQSSIPGSLLIDYNINSTVPFPVPKYLFIGLASKETTSVNAKNKVYIDDFALNNTMNIGDDNNSYPPIGYVRFHKPGTAGEWQCSWDNSNPGLLPPNVIRDWMSQADHLAGSQAGQRFYFAHTAQTMPANGTPTVIHYVTHGLDTNVNSNGFRYVEVDTVSGILQNLGSGFHNSGAGVVHKNIATKPNGKKRTRLELQNGLMLGLEVS